MGTSLLKSHFWAFSLSSSLKQYKCSERFPNTGSTKRDVFCSFQVRHNIRPYFLTSDSHKCVYDVITWATTQIAVSYTVVPFVLLAVGSSLKFYRYARRSESHALSLCNQRAVAVAHLQEGGSEGGMAPRFLQRNDCYMKHVNGVTGHRVEINALPLARITLVKL